MSEIAWSLPGPTHPVEWARATGLEEHGDQYRLVQPVEGSTKGLPDVEEQHAKAQRRLREACGR